MSIKTFNTLAKLLPLMRLIPKTNRMFPNMMPKIKGEVVQPTSTIGTFRRRRKNVTNGFNTNNGIEINRAEGGYKDVHTPGRIVSITINTYGRLIYRFKLNEEVWIPQFKCESDNYTTVTSSIDVANELNSSIEFTENRQKSEEYKVRTVCLTIDYNRVPKSGERIPKLLLQTVTDKIGAQNDTEMKYENNIMKLNMDMNGVKNYNTRINRANTLVENTSWIKSTYTWPAVWAINVTQEDTAQLERPNEETEYIIGNWKLSVQVFFRVTDKINSVTMSKPPNVNELLKEVATLKNKLKLLVVDDKKDENKEEEEIKDGKLNNIKAKMK